MGDDGSTCGSTYQTEVDAATTANTNAQSALTEAQTALNSAQAQSVTLVQAYTVDPAVTYFTNNPAWVAARTAHDSATSALATAQGAATAAASALTEAQATQTHQINVCRCTAQTAMAAALSTNDNNNNAQQNTANWNQAHQLLCVLDNTSPCNFGPAPTVQSRTLPADVSGATCPAPGSCTTGMVRATEHPGETAIPAPHPYTPVAGTAFYPQIFYEGSFYPICGHYFWDNNDGATTVCRALGFSSGSKSEPRTSVSPANAMPVGKCSAG